MSSCMLILLLQEVFWGYIKIYALCSFFFMLKWPTQRIHKYQVDHHASILLPPNESVNYPMDDNNHGYNLCLLSSPLKVANANWVLVLIFIVMKVSSLSNCVNRVHEFKVALSYIEPGVFQLFSISILYCCLQYCSSRFTLIKPVPNLGEG